MDPPLRASGTSSVSAAERWLGRSVGGSQAAPDMADRPAAGLPDGASRVVPSLGDGESAEEVRLPAERAGLSPEIHALGTEPCGQEASSMERCGKGVLRTCSPSSSDEHGRMPSLCEE
eukprot:9758209-Alexandrium_andersonii.AAC.1